jgi:hypothetical protein
MPWEVAARGVWSLQAGNLVISQIDLQGSHGVIEVRGLCGADERSNNNGVGPQPCQGNLCPTDSSFARDGRHGIDDGPIT